MKKNKGKPEVIARTNVDIIGDSLLKATISEGGATRMTYHGPKGLKDRGELLPGLQRERKKISPLLTGEKRGKSVLIYNAARDEHIAEYIVPGWLKQADGEELHIGGRLIRWTRKGWQFNVKIKLYEGNVHLASLKMWQSFCGGLEPYGNILWHTDMKSLPGEDEVVMAIIFIASEFVIREFVKRRRLAAGRIDGGIGLLEMALGG